MKYAVYRLTHGENVRWYIKPFKAKGTEKYPYIFEGDDARFLACKKAKELNEDAGALALAA